MQRAAALELRVSYLQVHHFSALVDAHGEGVVVFSRLQDLLQGCAGALSTLGGLLDQNFLESHDEDDVDIPQKGEQWRVCTESKSEREQSAFEPAASSSYTLQLVRRIESAAP